GRWPPDVMRQQTIELGTERRVGTGGKIARRQLFDRRDERLGHEAAAVGTEVTPRIGIASAKSRYRSHVVTTRTNAARALATKRATLSRSFTPGADSTPDDTSTPIGRTVMMAS